MSSIPAVSPAAPGGQAGHRDWQNMHHRLQTFLSPRCSVKGLFHSAVVVTTLATLLGFAGPFGWFFDLFSHFRVQYALLLLCAALVSVFARWQKLTLALLMLAIVNTCVVAPLLFHRTSDPGATENLRAVLVNVNAANRKPEPFFAFLKKSNPDFVIIEEITPAWTGMLTNLAKTYPFSVVQPRDDCFGIGLYSRIPLLEETVIDTGPAAVPSVRAAIVTHVGKFVLIGTHPVPPKNGEQSRWRNEHLQEIAGIVNKSKWPVLVVGDLNTSPWSINFRRFLRDAELTDSMMGFGIQASWPTYLAPLRIPIDHVLHTAGFRIADRRLGPDIGSDHFPVIVDFCPPQPQEP